ncbi:hypothetical protein [Corallococcus sp. AB049A]|uniref:hypothetical protein n=1 Tax=Corallococcus sp. AB049A TaxID=2316721 RepID=UPI0011C490D9|nr:hypothetical protein [Corallococcus sp. AB049A]
MAFLLLLTGLLVVSVTVASIAMAVEIARTGVDPRDSKAVLALTEQLKTMSWLQVAGVITSRLLGMAAALLGGFLSPKPLKERLRLGPATPFPVWAWGTALVGCFTMGQAMESLSVLTSVWGYTASLKELQAVSQGALSTFAL